MIQYIDYILCIIDIILCLIDIGLIVYLFFYRFPPEKVKNNFSKFKSYKNYHKFHKTFRNRPLTRGASKAPSNV